MPDPSTLTIARAAADLQAKAYSARELAESYLRVIEVSDPQVHAYLEVYDDVLAQADEADNRIASGESTPLLGIPLAIKDNILCAGKLATSGSKILSGYRAPYDATVVARLKAHGAVFLGRTNMDEFAMGSSTENSSYGVTKNPRDLSRVPGGSSGGSAAAVAMNGAAGALGSDTGGSIRQPASFCGVVGLKPTYGSVSRYGLMAMGSSLDQIGPLTKTVTDAQLLFDAIAGYDPLDSTSLPERFRIAVPVKPKLVIGVPRDFVKEGIDPDVLENFEQSLHRLQDAGHKIIDVSLPTVPSSLAVYYIIMPAEASTNLARFDGVKYGLHHDGADLLEDYMKTRGEGFGPEVRRRILLGTYVLSAGYYDAYYGKANDVRALISAEFSKTFETVDVIAVPTTPSPAFTVGEKTADPLSMYLSDIFTVPINLVGVPAISVPSGTVKRGASDLPVSLQLIAPHSHESVLFRLGKEFLNERHGA
jgi:aspartyl-tRNA(Asn)/glutamyl-tRNA(Gln) amidotransferase subunit A